MRKKLLMLSALLLVALAGYAVIRIPRWGTEDDIREAVFRYEFSRTGSACAGATAYYLSVICGWSELSEPSGTPIVDSVLSALGLAREPSDRWDGPSASSGLVRRFRSHKPIVRSASQCRIQDAMGVTDARGVGKGLVFVTGRIRWLSPTKVEVEGGYYENGTSASGYVYRLVRRHGRWVVVGDKLTWFS